MRVRKLEVFGFKSFAHKTTIHFEPGVTAIVGPNGSGKSNIVDAIRWVLGEHNPRDVRAPRLEDVIFNGTDQKAPLSMAEVQLTIDNEQGLLPISFAEVTICRRVYRSGESEYFINQSPCRLKDIQELLLGTGLGGGTYAIIEQGHIDMVLSSKPEERRAVFEEASGVAKYLAKKQETIRRLDEVEEHLVRIADIIGEVRRQVGALERAANKARQYKSQWDQLKQLELRLAVDELCAGQTRSHELEHTLQALTTTRDELDTQKQRAIASLEACNACVSATQQRMQGLRTRVVECASAIEQHESQRTLKTRWIDGLTQQVQQLEGETAALRQRLTQAKEQLARSSGAETEVQAQEAIVQGRLGEGSGELASLDATLQQTAHAITHAKAQLFDAASEASHQRNQLAHASAKLQGLEAHHTRLNTQRAQAVAQREELVRRHETASRARDALRAQSQELCARHQTALQALEAAGAHHRELTGRAHQLREQLASARTQVSLFEDLWRRYEGFPETVKTLMSQSIDGLIGPLVELVQAAPGYEDVIEAALGPLADAIVVRDRHTLHRCRETLSAQGLEGCRFLVLEDCPATPLTMEPPRLDAGVSGAVKQYLHTEPAYQPLVDWLLNDSWVINDIQHLLGSRAVPQGRLVSTRGDRWDRRSWRFNGSKTTNGAHGRVGRRQRWEHAQASLHSLEQDFNRLTADAQQAEQAWQAAMAQQETLKQQLVQLDASLHQHEVLLGQATQELQRVDDGQGALELERQDVTRQQEELGATVANTQQAVQDAQARHDMIERALADAHAARETAQQRKQQLLIARAQVEANLQSLTERLTALRARRQELEADHTQHRQQLEARARQQEDARQRCAELTQQLTTHEQGTAQLEQARIQLEREAEQVAVVLRDEEAKRDQVLPQLLAAEQQLSSLMQQIQQQQQQLSERSFRRERLVERLRELYQIDEATIQVEQQAHATALTDEQRATMIEQVQTLRAKLEGMGPVSLGSVDEYDELKRRLEFLQSQQQDLVKARDDLKASITQINRTARAQFRETFERIKQEFSHYYARLFNGGEANLILMDEEDVLESGIDIVARPPGKRLQSISLLSGGERALTAIALLFALFKVRPSPFCILDEIDAPLDEANVDRFTRVLEEFLALSQFILITHNKKTITKADSLYGVTMEEAGISKILSAKLTRAPSSPASVVAPTEATASH